MLPALIPRSFGELGPRPVHRLHGCRVTDTVVIRAHAYDRAILPVQLDIVLLEMGFAHAVEVPQVRESGPYGARG